jgi:hypothetical protein
MCRRCEAKAFGETTGATGLLYRPTGVLDPAFGPGGYAFGLLRRAIGVLSVSWPKGFRARILHSTGGFAANRPELSAGLQVLYRYFLFLAAPWIRSEAAYV